MRIFNIDWETDGYDVDLPNEVTIESMEEDMIADYLSDTYGWLVNSFEIER